MVIVSNYSESVIPVGITVRGTIEGSEKLTVAGTVDGEIHLQGSLRVQESGHLRGRVMVWQALICGRFEGTLMASEKAEILSTAQVEGEIRTRRLTIVEGALINGKLFVGSAEAQLSKSELIEEAVRWDEAHRLPSDEGGGLVR